MSIDDQVHDIAIASFTKIIKNGMIKTESLKEIIGKLKVAELEIEKGIDIDLDLGILEFIK